MFVGKNNITGEYRKYITGAYLIILVYRCLFTTTVHGKAAVLAKHIQSHYIEVHDVKKHMQKGIIVYVFSCDIISRSSESQLTPFCEFLTFLSTTGTERKVMKNKRKDHGAVEPNSFVNRW